VNVLAVLLCLFPGDVFDPGAGDFLDQAVYFDAAFDSADSCYRAGDWEAAAGFFLQGLRAQPWDHVGVYNLACCYGLMDRADLASVYLLRAWRLGFGNMELERADRDFDPVRDDPGFAALEDSLEAAALRERAMMGSELTLEIPGPFRCLVQTPEGCPDGGPYPLLLCLHGYGSTPEQFMTLWETAREFPCIMAAPQAPVPFDTGQDLGYSWVGEGYPAEKSRAYILGVLEQIQARYPVGRVYLVGFSQGAGMAYLTGLSSPERFAGIAPFAGYFPEEITDMEIEAARALPVRVVHGEQDGAVPLQQSLDAVALLASHGLDVNLRTFQGGHVFPLEQFREVLSEFLGTAPEGGVL
jgi:phospholipase/carboxylesterase